MPRRSPPRKHDAVTGRSKTPEAPSFSIAVPRAAWKNSWRMKEPALIPDHPSSPLKMGIHMRPVPMRPRPAPPACTGPPSRTCPAPRPHLYRTHTCTAPTPVPHPHLYCTHTLLPSAYTRCCQVHANEQETDALRPLQLRMRGPGRALPPEGPALAPRLLPAEPSSGSPSLLHAGSAFHPSPVHSSMQGVLPPRESNPQRAPPDLRSMHAGGVPRRQGVFHACRLCSMQGLLQAGVPHLKP